MEVYQLALRVSAELDVMARGLPEYRADLRDQLRRASTSVLLNVAEGAGEFSPGDKARFYRIARRSAAETSAIIDFLFVTGTLKQGQADPRADLHRIEAMLTALVRSVERRKS